MSESRYRMYRFCAIAYALVVAGDVVAEGRWVSAVVTLTVLTLLVTYALKDRGDRIRAEREGS